MRLQSLPKSTRDEDVEVRVSETRGLGVFLKPGRSLRERDIVTEYKGPPRWVTVEELAEIESEMNDYTYTIGPYQTVQGMYHILWDASEFKRCNFDGPKGHWLNSSHPQLHGDWKFPNCWFAVYDKDLVADIRTRPENVRLYIMCCRSVVGDGKMELLLDYHWHITEYFGLFCGDYDCVMCFNGMNCFMRKWKLSLRDKGTI